MLDARFASPTSVDEAVAALAADGAGAAVLAGGTDLLVQARTGLRNPGLYVDIKRIPELMALEIDAGGMRLGASVPAAQIYENQAVRSMYPGFSEAVDLIGSSQIQGRATVGGNLCNASPAADTVPSLIALGAKCVVAGPNGQREIAAEDFTTGPGRNALGDGEFLVRLDFPPQGPGAADAYLRLIPRTEMDIAVVGAAVSVKLAADGTCEAARVAIGAVAPTALLVPDAAAALVGTALDDAAIAQAGAAAGAAANPIDDKRGTVAYRRRVASVLTQRSARIAADRARERQS